MDGSSYVRMNYYVILSMNFVLSIQGQFYLPDVCFITFNNATVTSDPSNPNANMFVCPSSCYTMEYRSNQQAYPLYGNESYSGNSLICKAALHDGRVTPWNAENSTIFIRNSSIQSVRFLSSLRNGILSATSIDFPYLVYQFISGRINESAIPDIAIEHRGYLYTQDHSSSITCRSKIDIYPIQPINIDDGWQIWSENQLKYFTFPQNYTRNQAITFCANNNGVLMYWANLTEQEMFQELFSSTIYDLFRLQRATYTTLNFFIGLKQINQSKQWESNIIPYNNSLNSFFNITTPEDYCTILQLTNLNPQSIRIYNYSCNDTSINGYPFCRLLPSVSNKENDFVYRLETDIGVKNLSGVMDFCAELGGYPIYAFNAYEWQLIQEIMLKDPNFNVDYVYTGLVSQTKQVTDAYWLPRNISYNSSLNYISFAASRGIDRIGYHLSKAADESYYLLYDINPETSLNNLRFCRKNDTRLMVQDTTACSADSCTSNCVNITLPSQSDDARFGFYACMPTNSLVGIIYTQAFPVQSDFIRPNLPMDYSVALRRSYTESLSLSFTRVNQDLVSLCYEYLNFDRTSPSDDTIALMCDSTNLYNLTMTGITFIQNFNGLMTFAFTDRRMSGHQTRYIDYQRSDSRCRYQGIYHPYINQCICAPGFIGIECQYTCPPGYYGQTCDFVCHGDDNYCKGLLICLPDPYGCSCYTGWYGTYCNISCPMNLYGPDCAYQCPCSNCNSFTGVCDCNGTECYEGPYNRQKLQSQCSSSSSTATTNLILLIVLPIIGGAILISLIAVLLYWKLIRSRTNEFFSPNPDIISENL